MSLLCSGQANRLVRLTSTKPSLHRRTKTAVSFKVNDRGTRVPSLPLLRWHSMVLSSSRREMPCPFLRRPYDSPRSQLWLSRFVPQSVKQGFRCRGRALRQYYRSWSRAMEWNHKSLRSIYRLNLQTVSRGRSVFCMGIFRDPIGFAPFPPPCGK
jgi:hypothetical protein